MTHVFNKKMRHDGLGIWLKAKFIAQSIMTHYNAFNNQGSADQRAAGWRQALPLE